MSKQEVLDRVLVAWEANPRLRLGQLLDCATKLGPDQAALFDIEDEQLVEVALDYNSTEVRRQAEAKVTSIKKVG